LAAALILGLLVGNVPAIVRLFFETFSNERYVIPICSAMGFAHVLKQTGCDAALVRLLMAPVRRVRIILVPGTVLVGFFVNIPVVSQTSTAVCLGTVVVPVLRSAGISPITTGAALLIGASIGGELLNPGAPELLTIQSKTGVDTRQMMGPVARLLIPHLLLTMALFWLQEWRRPKELAIADGEAASALVDRPFAWGDWLRALVPLVPLALLLMTGPPLHWFTIPESWLVAPKAAAGTQSTRLVGLAMLVGVGVAALAAPRRAGGCLTAFFTGAGYGFTHVVSLIITANCFGRAVEMAGLTRPVAGLIAEAPTLLYPLAAVVAFAFALICGSGMAATQSLYGVFHDAAPVGSAPLDLGAMVSLAAATGRTLSPVAAVGLMCGSLVGVSPTSILRRAFLPLTVSLLVVTLARTLGGL
jgi:DcuC family C4-dicarboxylate transporter